MPAIKLRLLALIQILTTFFFSTGTKVNIGSGELSYSESWGYVNVRPDAYMFWWLYYVNANTDPNRPLILWLQGGPGSSGCGFGNFQEIGPLDTDNNPRNTTWLLKGDLIFVDNPVGTGFSYVTNDSAFSKDIDQISADLLTWATHFFNYKPQYQKRPFYIMSESYGGKMTAAFANVLYPAMKSGGVKVNFKGVGLGDSWISPMDFVNSWGPYLYYMSMMSDADLLTYKNKAGQCQSLVDGGQWYNASVCWDETEVLVGKLCDGVSWYNVLKRGGSDPWSTSLLRVFETSTERFTRRHLSEFAKADLNTFMNGPIKAKLGIIPKNVSWGGQSGQVFQAQMTDFMKPVIDIVDNLLANTNLKVVIYNGQLDLICDTVGVETWMKKLKWAGMGPYRKTQRIPFHAGPPPETYDQTAGFYKNYKNFYFFWIMRAGHMVPADAPYAARRMLDIIMQN